MESSINTEIDSLAVEIVKSRAEFDNQTKNLLEGNSSPKRMDKIPLGFLMIDQAAKEYSFKRFYKLADEKLLSPSTIELYNTLTNQLQELSKSFQDQKDLPQELNDFLNK